MSQIIRLPQLLRDAEVRANSFDEEARTIEVVFTAGATVRRISWRDGEFDEELVVEPAAVRLGRLNGGAAFLDSHDDWSLDAVLGSVVPGTARIEKGQGLAKIKLSGRQDRQGVVQDIRDGIIRSISVGYRIWRVEKEERDGQVPLHRVVDWEPHEISAVAVPADPGAYVRSAAAGRQVETYPCTVVTRGAGIAAKVRMAMANRRLGLR